MSTESAAAEGQPAVDVVVVNWNSRGQLHECIDSLITYGRPHVQRIMVVDNGSTDGSETAAEGREDVRLIRAECNLGFAKACNLGVAQGTADYLLLLNPDTRIFPDSLSSPLVFLQQPDAGRVGIVGIQNVGHDGRVQRSCARFPTPWSFIVHSLGLSAMWPRHFPDHMMRDWPHDQDRRVDHVIGSFFLVRRQLWNRLGGMDERFFVYLEDLDFSIRAHAQGWSTWYLARAQIYHKGGGTSEQVKATRLFYSLRSRLLYAAKHFGWMGFAGVVATTLLIEPFTRIAAAIARRESAAVAETLRAYAALYRALPAIARRTRSSG